MIKLVRCDDRLIHGQCMTNVVKVNNIDNIIVVDDFTASNPVLKMVFSTAVPATMKANVYSIKESLNIIKEAAVNSSTTLILMRSPSVFVELRKGVDGLPNEFNIGPMSSKKDAKQITPYAYLLHNEIEALKQLEAEGIHIYFRQLSTTKLTEWNDIKNNL